LRLPDGKFGRVITRDVLDELERVRPANFNLTHVADVKQASGRARGHMLGHNARILDRHIPPAKIDHFGFEAAMHTVQRRLAKLGSGRRSHSKFSGIPAQNRN
jgi:hypothetical protein